MSNRLFVGNLPYEATEEELRAHFSEAGSVRSVFIPLDRETGRPRGFAFIEFETPDEATTAIGQLHQKPFMDRPLVVNEARPNESRPAGGFRPPPRPGGAGPRPGPPPPPGAGFGDESGRERPRRPPGPRSRRRSGKKGGWDEGPRKEPIPEKRRNQILSGYDDVEEEEVDIDFDDFATRAPESEEDQK